MKNFLALLGAVFLILVVMGWILGWYSIDRHAHDGEEKLHITLDTDKIHEDIEKGKEKIKSLLTKKQPVAGSEASEPMANFEGPPEPFIGPPAPPVRETLPPSEPFFTPLPRHPVLEPTPEPEPSGWFWGDPRKSRR